jgi:inward rectifier potassium channel
MADATPPPKTESPAAPKKDVRLLKAASALPPVITIGQKRTPLDDVYHWILTRTWVQFFGVVAGTFVALNSVFALLYLTVPGAITNLPAGSFEDAFYFSVQTLATIGYGVMSPATRAGHLLVALEALVGMLSVALMTGITFAKFARPTARVLFADKATITPRGGVPHLMFRMANWRGNQMVDAALKVIVLVTETTPEGETMRIPIELPLVREKTFFFILTWMPMHRIDENSPFHGPDAIAKLRAKKAEIFLSLTGYDETMGATVHTRHQYKLDDIVMNARFADVLEVREDGRRVLNYLNFNDTIPIGATAPLAREAEPLSLPEPVANDDLTAATVEALLPSEGGGTESGDTESGNSQSENSQSGSTVTDEKGVVAPTSGNAPSEPAQPARALDPVAGGRGESAR